MASYALENRFIIKPRGASWDDDPLYAFDNSQIVLNSPKGVFSSDIIGNELAVDQFSFTVRFDASGRRLYIFDNTPKLAYIFSGYVPGTLANIWTHSIYGSASISGNDVSIDNSTSWVHLIPPGGFSAGDALRVGVEVTDISGSTSEPYTPHYYAQVFVQRSPTQWFSYAEVESETGLFSVSEPGYANFTGGSTENTGKDILTFTFTKSADYISFSTRGAFALDSVSAQLKITGIELNGKMVYGDLSGNSTEADKPPKVYLFRPKYDASRFLADLRFGDPCYWAVGENVFAKGYISKIERTGRYAWKVTCVSGVGLLDEQISVGGIYTGQRFDAVFAEIVGDTITYDIDNDVAAVKIFGWLPYDTARNNLHRLLFATGAALARHNVSSDDNDIDYDVKFPGKVIRVVPEDHVAINGSVTLNIPADGVEVTEHTFSALQSDEVVQLYDNTLPEIAEADHLTVTFSEPMHDLDAGGFTIHESGVNYAIISGTGVLTGKKYTHTETVYPLGNPLGKIVKRIVSNGLITFANSLNVARRVLNYFQSAKAVKAKLMLNDGNGAQSVEKPGDTLQMTDAWGEAISAYMSKQEVGVTSIFGASVELVDGYTPTGGGNNYQRYKFFTRSSSVKTFTVTAGMSTVRIALFQGGTGGQGGEAGHDGWGGYPPSFGDPEDGQMAYVEDVADPPYYPVPEDHGILEVHSYLYGEGRQYAFDGGQAGEPGANGKILVITKDVEEGDVITFTQIGEGGQGGAARANGATGGLGAAGTHTIVKCERNGVEIWSASSEDGAAVDSGFLEAFTNRVFGLQGEAGHDGGKGGTTDSHDLKFANTGARGNSGGDVGSWSAGAPGKGVVVDAGFGFHEGSNNTASGGGSGGAAWGANGGPGKNATYVKRKNDDNTWTFNVTTGTGGDGANAVAPSAPKDSNGRAAYGQGGTGGNGGGSGGNNGGGVVKWMNAGGGGVRGAQLFIGVRDSYHLSTVFNGGKGGSGSKGGRGGDGLGILYY